MYLFSYDIIVDMGKITFGRIIAWLTAMLFIAVSIVGFTKGQSFPTHVITITGVVGSEKKPFFEDPEVQAVFKKHGYEIKVDTSGSWEMSDKDGLESYDFAFPSSDISAQHLIDAHKNAVKGNAKPFYSPLAIGSFTNIMNILEKNGITKQQYGQWHVDMNAYLQAAKAGKRWNELTGNTDYNSNRSMLITSTDVRSSNSAGMYLGLMSYVNNGNNPPEISQSRSMINDLSGLFLNQGYSQESSAGPWESYLDKGPGLSPMVMIYEAQYLETMIQTPDRMKNTMTLAYPEPGLMADHVIVAFSDNGLKIMDLLQNDKELAGLIAKHGFRVNGANSNAFNETMKSHGLNVPDSGTFTDMAAMPSYETMQSMINEISKEYQK